MYAVIHGFSACCRNNNTERSCLKVACCALTKLALAILFNVALGGAVFSAIFFPTQFLVPAIVVPVTIVTGLFIIDLLVFIIRQACCQKKEIKEIELTQEEERFKERIETFNLFKKEFEEKLDPKLTTKFTNSQWSWLYAQFQNLEWWDSEEESELEKYLGSPNLPGEKYGIFTFSSSPKKASVTISLEELSEHNISWDDFYILIGDVIRSSHRKTSIKYQYSKIELSLWLRDLSISVSDSDKKGESSIEDSMKEVQFSYSHLIKTPPSEPPPSGFEQLVGDAAIDAVVWAFKNGWIRPLNLY